MTTKQAIFHQYKNHYLSEFPQIAFNFKREGKEGFTDYCQKIGGFLIV